MHLASRDVCVCGGMWGCEGVGREPRSDWCGKTAALLPYPIFYAPGCRGTIGGKVYRPERMRSVGEYCISFLSPCDWKY